MRRWVWLDNLEFYINRMYNNMVMNSTPKENIEPEKQPIDKLYNNKKLR